MAHSCVRLRHGVAHAVAVRHLEERCFAVTGPMRIGSNSGSNRGSRIAVSGSARVIRMVAPIDLP
jgi:hypothetical protein